MMRKKGPLELISRGIIFVLFGALLVYLHGFIEGAAKEAANWPITEATVRFAEVIKDDHINALKPAVYRHGVIYDFQVNGIPFSGEALHIEKTRPLGHRKMQPENPYPRSAR